MIAPTITDRIEGGVCVSTAVEDPVLTSFADLAKSSRGLRHEGIGSVDLRGTALDRGCTRVMRAGCGTNVAVHRTATGFWPRSAETDYQPPVAGSKCGFRDVFSQCDALYAEGPRGFSTYVCREESPELP